MRGLVNIFKILTQRAIVLGLTLSFFISKDLKGASIPQGSIQASSWGMYTTFGIGFQTLSSKDFEKCAKSTLVVATIDTGIDLKHPDLKNSIWINEKEAFGKKGSDDDGNGFIDDLHGWDFVRKTGELMDVHGHGTHIAGIIAAHGSTPQAYKGSCPGVKIMSLRYYDVAASGLQNLNNSVKALEYAISKKVDIINYSGGGAQFSQIEYTALKKAEAAGIFVVAAAGNERQNADEFYYYPAAYNLSNILSVTAIDKAGQILSSANWGKKNVHIAAPGGAIISTLPNASYGLMTGTSQATAFVSGIAALLLTHEPTLPYSRLKAIIENSGDKIPHLIKTSKTGAKVNVAKALALLREKQQRTLSATSSSTQKIN